MILSRPYLSRRKSQKPFQVLYVLLLYFINFQNLLSTFQNVEYSHLNSRIAGLQGRRDSNCILLSNIYSGWTAHQLRSFKYKMLSIVEIVVLDGVLEEGFEYERADCVITHWGLTQRMKRNSLFFVNIIGQRNSSLWMCVLIQYIHFYVFAFLNGSLKPNLINEFGTLFILYRINKNRKDIWSIEQRSYTLKAGEMSCHRCMPPKTNNYDLNMTKTVSLYLDHSWERDVMNGERWQQWN